MSIIKKYEKTSEQLEQGKMYLSLIHGRKKPDENVEDWGFDGPFIGPLSYCHITYMCHVKLAFKDGINVFDDDAIIIKDDLLYYDGNYYGDWSIHIHSTSKN
tara:strand:- start:52 stop:357 length:306 start_codon:yes stop_codon:yes gene_type:complete